MRKINDKFFISGGLLLVLMFIHLVSIVNDCSKQVMNNTSTISAFNG